MLLYRPRRIVWLETAVKKALGLEFSSFEQRKPASAHPATDGQRVRERCLWFETRRRPCCVDGPLLQAFQGPDRHLLQNFGVCVPVLVVCP